MKSIIARLEENNLSHDDLKMIADEVNNNFSDQEVFDIYGFVTNNKSAFLTNLLKLHKFIKPRVVEAIQSGVSPHTAKG